MSSLPTPPAGSVSKVDCVASVRGKGEVKVALYRHLAPLTLNAILRSLPINSRVILQPATACLFTEVRVGVEKPRLEFARGEVAFLPSASLICFFLKDSKSDRPLNPVGKVEDGLSLFDDLHPGDVVSLAAAPAPQPAAPQA